VVTYTLCLILSGWLLGRGPWEHVEASVILLPLLLVGLDSALVANHLCRTKRCRSNSMYRVSTLMVIVGFVEPWMLAKLYANVWPPYSPIAAWMYAGAGCILLLVCSIMGRRKDGRET